MRREAVRRVLERLHVVTRLLEHCQDDHSGPPTFRAVRDAGSRLRPTDRIAVNAQADVTFDYLTPANSVSPARFWISSKMSMYATWTRCLIRLRIAADTVSGGHRRRRALP
ncbi:hypothetical protein HDC31_001633 [Microbacterium sp. JAI119]|nr:hypothetical protein [Microbacterium sp. JAI119]